MDGTRTTWRGARRRRVIALAALSAVVVVACGGDDDTGSTAGPETDTAPTSGDATSDDITTTTSPVDPAPTATSTAPDATAPPPTSPAATSPPADDVAPTPAEPTCVTDEVIAAVSEGLVDRGVPVEAIEHAAFDEVICVVGAASVRVERLSDPGYRVVLGQDGDDWTLLEPLAPLCDDHAQFDVRDEDWHVLVPSAAIGSEAGWVECPPLVDDASASAAAGSDALVAAPDGLGVVAFGADLGETVETLTPLLGDASSDHEFETACGAIRAIGFGGPSGPGLTVWFGLDGPDAVFERYEIGIQGIGPTLPDAPAWVEATTTAEGVGWASTMDDARSAYPDLTLRNHVVQSTDAMWDTGTGILIRDSDDVVVLVGAGESGC